QPAPRCSHGGDCKLHPDVRGLHDFAAIERLDHAALLAGPTEPLPETGSFEELMGAAQRCGDPLLGALARQVSESVDGLNAAYNRERKARALREEAGILRRELDNRLARLSRLASGQPDDQDAAAA